MPEKMKAAFAQGEQFILLAAELIWYSRVVTLPERE
jgi:hypothetical protein